MAREGEDQGNLTLVGANWRARRGIGNIRKNLRKDSGAHKDKVSMRRNTLSEGLEGGGEGLRRRTYRREIDLGLGSLLPIGVVAG